MKSYRLRPSLSYIWFIVIPPTLIIILGVFLNNYWTYGCSGFAFLLFHSLHSSYSIQCTRIHQHINNHKSADLNSAPFVLLLRSFSSRSGYSIEESGQVMLPGTTQPVEQYVVNSYIGNLDKALGKNGLILVVIGSQNLSLPKSHKVLIVECPDDQWQKNFRTLAKYAKAILIIPEKTTSIVDEIEYVKRQRLLARTIFLMPPIQRIAKQPWWIVEINFQRTERRDQRWEQLVRFFKDNGVALLPYDPMGAFILVGESNSMPKKISLNGKEDVDTFALTYRQIMPNLGDRNFPLSKAYRQLVPVKKYYDYDPIFDDVPGETWSFGQTYVCCMLVLIGLGSLTATMTSSWVTGLLVIFFGIISMGFYIAWVFSKRFRSQSRNERTAS